MNKLYEFPSHIFTTSSKGKMHSCPVNPPILECLRISRFKKLRGGEYIEFIT